MADHGVTLPERGAGGGQGGPPFPQGGPPTSSPGGTPTSSPDGGGGRGGGFFRQAPPGVDQQKFDAARAACQDKLPRGGFGGGDPAMRSARQAYFRCLSDNGVQVPTTVANAPGPRPSINRDDPAFAAADEKCRPLLPTTTTTASP